MDYIVTTLDNLVHQTAFFNLTWGNYLMIAVACIFLYLAIAKGFEPLLLTPIAFGMLLVNIYPDIMLHAEDAANGVGGLLYYFYKLDEWGNPAVPDFPGRRRHDGLRSPDCKPQELPAGRSGAVRYLRSLFRSYRPGLQ